MPRNPRHGPGARTPRQLAANYRGNRLTGIRKMAGGGTKPEPLTVDNVLDDMEDLVPLGEEKRRRGR